MRRSLITLLALTVLTGVLFALWPELDLMGSAFFHNQGGFFGDGNGLKGLRVALYFLPIIVMGCLAATVSRLAACWPGFWAG